MVSGLSNLRLLIIKAMSDTGYCSWHRPKIRPVISWPLTQVMQLYCPRRNCGQNRLQVKDFMIDLVTQFHHWKLVGYRRWPVLASCLQLLAFFMGLPSYNPENFYCTGFLHWPPMPFNSSPILLYSFLPSLPSHPTPLLPIPTCLPSPLKSKLLFLSRETHVSP